VSGSSAPLKGLDRNGLPDDVRGAADLPTEYSQETALLPRLHRRSLSGCMFGMKEQVRDGLQSAARNQLPTPWENTQRLTFIERKSSSISTGRAVLIFGAAGKPTYLATPERIETSRLYAV